MSPIIINSNTVILPEQIAKTMIGKEFTPIITDEGVLFKETRRKSVVKAKGILKNPQLSVEAFQLRKREEKKLEK